MNKEEDIIERATKALQEATGFQVGWGLVLSKELDGFVKLSTDTEIITFSVEVKQRANPHLVIQLTALKEALGDILLIAEFIPTDLQKTLKQLKLNYLDTAGNCCIQSKGQFILIEGRRAGKFILAGKQPFGKSGLRVIFTLLTQADSINLTVRELADRTGVSIGSVQQTIDGLKHLGYVVAVDEHRRKLVKVERLIEQWLNRYSSTLKPNLLVGKFRLPTGLQPNEWQKIKLQLGSYWSGEPAADALTNNLRPQKLTIYTEEDKSGLMRKYRLLPDEEGSVEIYQLFWRPIEEQISDPSIVPPLLIYTDLLASADPRNLENARAIYQKYVHY